MMQPPRLWVLWLWGFLVLFSASCSTKDDEKALQELVEKAARFAEQHDISAIMDLTTENFRAHGT
jgi:hypothetical protein